MIFDGMEYFVGQHHLLFAVLWVRRVLSAITLDPLQHLLPLFSRHLLALVITWNCIQSTTLSINDCSQMLCTSYIRDITFETIRFINLLAIIQVNSSESE